MNPARKTTEALLPLHPPHPAPGRYDLHPVHPLGGAGSRAGWDALAAAIGPARVVLFDGYGGVFWDELQHGLDAALRHSGRRAAWRSMDEFLRPPAEIEDLVRPFLGDGDPVWGTRFPGGLADFFVPETVAAARPDPNADLTVFFGPGAALLPLDGLLVYADLPKNEIQFRARAGSIANLACPRPGDPKAMYKRFYFVDWPALNRHRKDIQPRVAWFVDAQRPGEPVFAGGPDVRAALRRLARGSYRARPWFEPGVWGGQWCGKTVDGLNPAAPNYAWSFELIAPENGLLFAGPGQPALEISHDALLFEDGAGLLGPAGRDRFGDEFPIRFDFLDTMDGGNLSLQCHPSPEYIKRHFGETFTQDETYYMLEAGPDACVYLGFQEDADPAAFRAALEAHQATGAPVDVVRHVQRHPARKHDLFLIPNGTVHCSGKNGVVLEISATPYIFTFKMYDWGRLDLDGKPRPINIARAFENLRFDRRGALARRELLSVPEIIAQSPGWTLESLPTHPVHFYAVERLTFTGQATLETRGGVLVLNLVEGESIQVLANGCDDVRNYAETFVVAAAAGACTLVNLGTRPARVVCARLKNPLPPT